MKGEDSPRDLIIPGLALIKGEQAPKTLDITNPNSNLSLTKTLAGF